MTPGARVAAAIEILDIIGTGVAAEPALTRWARGHRFAGSGDRAAIRDHVFDVLRRRRSCAWLGGGTDGRQLMIGWAIASNANLGELFSGIGHAPAPVEADELTDFDLNEAGDAVRLDCPEWLFERFSDDLGKDAPAVLQALQTRAPVFLRANLTKSSRDQVQVELAKEGIETRAHDLSASALEITSNPRRFRNSLMYRDGLAELQDAASQAVVDCLPIEPNSRVLDYCAGGGGKSLAISGRGVKTVFAHDANPARMVDLPRRAERAGADVRIVQGAELPPEDFDLVLCDAPCSGSGAWRRSPAAKWDLTPEQLISYCNTQIIILLQASELVSINGFLAYVTCSLFKRENHEQVAKFLTQKTGFALETEKQFTPLDGGDGFFVALFRRVSQR